MLVESAMRGLLAVLCILLSGCAARLIEATPAGGIIGGYEHSQGSALRLAQQHCAQFGKNARISGTDVLNNSVMFDCVAQ